MNDLLEVLLALGGVAGSVLLFWDVDTQLLSLIGMGLVFGCAQLSYLAFRHWKLKGPMDFACRVKDD